MKQRLLFVCALFVLVASGIAQAQKTLITVDSVGDDVRSVIHNVFKQAGKSFVLKVNVRYELYLSLDKIEFEDAVKMICDNADLAFTIEKGVYQISPRAKVAVPAKPATTPKNDDLPPLDGFDGYEEKKEPAKPKGVLPKTVLDKKVTTRLQKRDIREVFDVFSKQTGLTIEVGKDVPSFKLDVFYINKTLKQALDEITVATRLKYRLTDQLSIAIEKLPPLSGPIGGGVGSP
jgi:type II secretory pathway component GspD/PulD (secretin)